jgi:ABC-type branched-subunit amino acid transport system ATPase component
MERADHPLLVTEELGIAFGGLRAVDGVDSFIRRVRPWD